MEAFSMETLFENRYERTKEFYKEFYSYSYFKNPVLIALNIVFAVILLLYFLVFPPSQINNFMISFIVVLFIAQVFRYKRVIDISYKRDLECNQGEPASILMALTNEEIGIHQIQQDSTLHFSYHDIKKVITTKNYYAAITKANLIIAFKKDGFVVGAPEECLTFLKNKIAGKA
jgi:hypothetical protein